MKKRKYIITTAGKFHHFDLARVIEKKNQLSKIITGYPWFKIKNENIPKKYVEPYGLYRILRQPILNYSILKNINDFLNISMEKKLDKISAKIIENIEDVDVFIGQSQCGLKSGLKIKEKKKIYICERTSTHIEFQNNILAEEYNLLGLKYNKINNWYIEREKQEYAESDVILVPSNFVKSTFESKYLPKVKVLEFGVNRQNFFRNSKIKKSDKYFDILYLASKSVRKGFHYTLEAFKKFKHPNKRLHIVGSDTSDKNFFQNKIREDNMIVYGHINHLKLNEIINFCHIYVLPSIEDGFATSILQVASAGCPVIVTENTGSADFVRSSNCGFVIPIRNVRSIVDKFEIFAENKDLIEEFSNNGQSYLSKYNWNYYFDQLELITEEKNKELT